LLILIRNIFVIFLFTYAAVGFCGTEKLAFLRFRMDNQGKSIREKIHSLTVALGILGSRSYNCNQKQALESGGTAALRKDGVSLSSCIPDVNKASGQSQHQKRRCMPGAVITLTQRDWNSR
jgi:hypothetical protein